MVAAGPLQQELNIPRELRAVERKFIGGRVPAHWYARRRVSDVHCFGRDNRSDGSRCRGSILGRGLGRRCWRADARVLQRVLAEKHRYSCRTRGIGADADAG